MNAAKAYSNDRCVNFTRLYSGAWSFKARNAYAGVIYNFDFSNVLWFILQGSLPC